MRTFRLIAAVLAPLALVAPACSGDGDDDPAAATSSTAASQFGSSMGVTESPASAVAELGDGPSPGQTWSVPVGLNVCGRFIEPLTGGPTEVAGSTLVATTEGRLEIVAGDEVSGMPLVADYAELVGMALSTGSLTLPEQVQPAVLDSTDPITQLAGATLDERTTCGGVPASVQVWVYSAEATDSGDGILVVGDQPELVPFSQEGMSVVVAFSPESSLPTLPPSAVLGG